MTDATDGSKDLAESETESPRSRATSLATSTRLLAIGASAGGPAALQMLLGGLPADFPAAVVIVQHLERQFSSGFVQWLAESSLLPIRMAQEGDRAASGTVLIANGAEHLCFKSPHRLGYERAADQDVHCPSIDVFFLSVCNFWRGEAIGLLLTGMGSDGARGLKALRDRGHHTIAQDQASSIIYGMPKAAVELSAAVEVLPIRLIASHVVSYWQRDPEETS